MDGVRRICWPDPDATCLEGGCGHCDGYPYRGVDKIRAYAVKAGELPNRYGGGTKDALKAFLYGEHRQARR